MIDRPGGGQTYLVFAGSFYGWVGRLRLQVDGMQVGLEDYRLFEVNASVPSQPQTKAALAPFKEAIVAQFSEVYRRPLAWALLPIANEIDPRTNKRDTAIGDLITDAYREAGHTEIAVEAGGFIDEGLPWGVVVGNDVFHTMPYGFPDSTTGLGFHLVTFTLTGAELLGALEYTLAAQGDFTPQVSGMTFRYDSRQPPFGQVLVETLRIRGQPFDPERRYRIAANEAVALRFLPTLGAQPQDVVIGGFAYDAIRDLVERRGLLFPVVGRIVDVGAVSQPRSAKRSGCLARSTVRSSVVVVPVVVAVVVAVMMLVRHTAVWRGGSTGRARQSRCRSQRDQAVELGGEVLAEHQAAIDQPLQGMRYPARVVVERPVALLHRQARIAGRDPLVLRPRERDVLP